ncbi:MAG: DinB family protein, partial [Pseudomonadota bacterium]
MKAHFEMLAGYNAWANGRLYDAAFALSEDDYRRDLGAFFGSLHGTLNHLFVADVIWLARFRGQPNPPWKLD